MKTYEFTKRYANRLDVIYAYNKMRVTKQVFISQVIVFKQILVPQDITHPFYHIPSGKRFKTLDLAVKFWSRRLKPAAIKKAENPFKGMP